MQSTGGSTEHPFGYCWVNGKPAAVIPADDRGLQFGDGLFETFVVREGQRPNFARHRQRLEAGCRRLRFPECVWHDLEAELDGILRGIAGQWVAKLILTRGSSPRGYGIPNGIEPRRLLTLRPWPRFPVKNWEEGVEVRVCELRLAHQPVLAGLKHLNRLENVLARAEWDDPDVHEGLLMDGRGDLVEGTMSNLFLATGGVVSTHPLQACGVAGVLRGWVLEQLAELDIPCRLEGASLEQLTAADEVWLCNSVFGLWPVKGLRIEPSMRWVRGPLTAGLQDLALAAFPWLALGYATD